MLEPTVDPVTGFLIPSSWLKLCLDPQALQKIRSGRWVLLSDGKLLRRGLTTGTTAAAACKGAVLSLKRSVDSVNIETPVGLMVSMPVIAKLSDRMNRKPFVLLTFAFFALFPLALVRSTGLGWLALAFVIAGLREIGEPARKALIVDLAAETARGRAVGMYYLFRGLVVFPASLVGGWLWTLDRTLPFYAAFAVGVAGCAAYAAWGPGRGRQESR